MTQRKISVYLKDYDMRFCDDLASSFAKEISIIMRNRVSQRLEGWSQASDDDRKIAYDGIIVSLYMYVLYYIMQSCTY